MIIKLKGINLFKLLTAALILLLLINIVILKFNFVGITQNLSQQNEIFFPKGWFIGLVWTILILFQTFVFKYTDNENNTKLVLLLIFSCMTYPIYTLGFSVLSLIFLGNLITLALSSFVAGMLFNESAKLSTFIFFTSIWIIVVTYLLFRVHS
jgi:hypothetical protein